MSRPIKMKRRRCALKRCNQLYPPKKVNQRFCCIAHRDEYHFKGEDYGKLHDDMVRLVEKTMKQFAPKLARDAFLILEADPGPAFVARVADRIRRLEQ